MLWKFNPDFTVRSMGGQVTWGFAVYECKFDKTKYKPSDWAGMNDQKEIELFLMGKGM